MAGLWVRGRAEREGARVLYVRRTVPDVEGGGEEGDEKEGEEKEPFHALPSFPLAALFFLEKGSFFSSLFACRKLESIITSPTTPI